MDKQKLKQLWAKTIIETDEKGFDDHSPSLTYRPLYDCNAVTQGGMDRPTKTLSSAQIEDMLEQTANNTETLAQKGNGKPEFSDNDYAGMTDPPHKPFDAWTATLPFNQEDGAPPIIPVTQKKPYDLVDEIGRGGMGVVYRARQNSLEREVAIKKILPSQLSTDLIDRFASEARVTGDLDHPNIVPVYDLCNDGTGEIQLAMKFIGGVEWKQLLHPENIKHVEAAKDLTLEDHLRTLLNVCNAVAFAHSRHIVHCDLKPENVMIGDYGEVFVMDWGIALDIRDQSKVDDSTKTVAQHKSTVTSPRGTPIYMPPELAEGQGSKIGVWTDVYLLGAILHEILTGAAPHGSGSKSLTQVLLAACQSRPPNFDDDVPIELQDICSKALEANEEERYQCIKDFKKAIEDHLSHRESLRISTEAKKVLKSCRKMSKDAFDESRQHQTRDQLYANFSEVVAGFHQAAILWEENPEAKEGQYEARIAFAESALDNDDLGLAEAQVSRLPPERDQALALTAAINKAKAARLKQQKIAQQLRWGLAAALGIILFGLAGGIIFAIQKNKQERQLRLDEQAQRMNAEKAKLEAVNAQNLAEDRRRFAETQRKVALEEKARALRLLVFAYVEKARAALAKGDTLGARVLCTKALTIDNQTETRSLLYEIEQRGGRKIWTSHHRLRSSCLAFSPDGKTLASASVTISDSTIRLWDLASNDSGDLREIAIFEGQQGKIKSVDFSPDGTLLASASDDKSIFLWDTRSRQKLRAFKGHGEAVNAVCFSPDGKVLASASQDLRLWDVQTGKRLATVTGHKHWLMSICFSPNGKILASASADKSVRLWDLASGFKDIKEIAVLLGHQAGVLSVSFSPDGKTLASGSWDHSIRLWDIPSEPGAPAKLRRSLKGHEGWVWSVAFSPDGQRLASVSDDSTLKLWDVRSGKPLHNIKAHEKAAVAVAFSPDGKTLASASADDTLKIWQVDDSQKIEPSFSLKGHSYWIWTVVTSADNQWIASAGEDKTICLWRVTDDAQIKLSHRVKGAEEAIKGLCFTPDSKRIVSVSKDGEIYLWKIDDGQLKSVEDAEFDGHDESINSVVVTPDGQIMATACSDNSVGLWSIAGGEAVASLEAHSDVVLALAISPDGRFLASASEDKTIILWNLRTRTKVRILKGHEAGVRSLAFSEDSKTLASGSLDKTIRLWKVSDGRELTSLKGHQDRVNGVAFSKDSKMLTSVSSDKTVRLWDIESGTPRLSLRGHESAVLALAIMHRTDWLVSVGVDQTMRLWDVSQESRTRLFKGHEREVLSLAASKDGSKLISASFDNTIKLWDLKNPQKSKTFKSHKDAVHSVAFHPNDHSFASGSKDGTVCIWRFYRQKPLQIVREGIEGAVRSLAYRPDGSLLAIAGAGKKIHLWVLDKETLAGPLCAPLMGHTKIISTLAFCPKGRYLVSGSDDHTVRIWDCKDSKPSQVQLLDDHRDSIHSLAFSPNGAFLASAGELGAIKLWSFDFASGEASLIRTLKSRGDVMSVAFSPDSQLLASAGDESEVVLWQIPSGRRVLILRGHKESIRSVLFNSNGGSLVSAGDDKIIRCWRFGEIFAQPKMLLDLAEQRSGLKIKGLQVVNSPHNRLVPTK
jgi:WD40 repeat protein/serine/threonine protein kinase